MYKRPKVYPSGAPIPESLPDSYQPSSYGVAPAGQSCFTCKSFDMVTRQCDRWDAAVKPRWWCAAWAANSTIKPISAPMLHNSASSALVKKVTTNTVEEHFSDIPGPMSAQFRSGMDNGYNWYDPGISVPEPDPENEEDVIRVNVPLMIRLLEYAREHASDDVVLHVMVERMTELCEDGDVLEMEDYTGIVPAAENGTE